MKAKFNNKQQPVKYYEHDDLIYIFVALNGVYNKESTNDDGESQEGFWEYDYNEIHTNKTNIDISDVIANPENYLEWEESIESDIIGKLKTENEELRSMINEQADALIELASIIVEV